MKDDFGRNVRYLRVSLTDLCNYRCLYCMKEGGVEKKPHDAILTLEETYAVVEAFRALGGEKVRFTGGEPLVRKNALSLIERVGKLGFDTIGLTTNGVLLPTYAERLAQAGVTAVNVSIDSLDEEKYAFVTRGGRLADALSGLSAAKEHFPEVKLNAVLMRGINDDVRPFATFAAETDVPLRFIELMPFAENDAYGNYGISASEVIEKNALTLVKKTGNAEYYRFPDGVEIGFIRPLSNKFCDGCDRLRLTSDGKILPCLHGSSEIDLKPFIANGNIKDGILKAVQEKPYCHNIDNGILQKRKMISIGG